MLAFPSLISHAEALLSARVSLRKRNEKVTFTCLKPLVEQYCKREFKVRDVSYQACLRQLSFLASSMSVPTINQSPDCWFLESESESEQSVLLGRPFVE